MISEAQKQRYQYNQAVHQPTHYHGYAVQYVAYRTVYRAGSEAMRWVCSILLPYRDLSANEVLEDARQIWTGCPEIQAIVGVDHIGMVSTVALGPDTTQSIQIVALEPVRGGGQLCMTLEAQPCIGSPLWRLSAHALQEWLDRTAVHA